METLFLIGVKLWAVSYLVMFIYITHPNNKLSVKGGLCYLFFSPISIGGSLLNFIEGNIVTGLLALILGCGFWYYLYNVVGKDGFSD